MARRRHFKITVEGKVYDVVVDEVTEGDAASLYPHPDLTHQATEKPAPPPISPSAPAPSAGANDKLAPMGGLVLEVSVEVGAAVAAGDRVAVLEAMKMKQVITAHRAGTVSKIHVSAGQSVDGGQPLMTIE